MKDSLFKSNNLKNSIVVFCMLIGLLLGGCNKEKAVIFMSSRPINQQEYYPEKVFDKGRKVNIGAYNPKGFESSLIRIQVVKVGKYGHWGYSIEHARDIEIDKSKNYFLSDFYIYNKGSFVLRIFGHDNMEKPIVETEFWIR